MNGPFNKSEQLVHWVASGIVAATFAIVVAGNEWLGLTPELAGVGLTVGGIILVLYQLREATEQLTKDRRVEVVKLTTEWLEDSNARKQRQQLYTEEFLIHFSAGAVGELELHNPVSAWMDVSQNKKPFQIAESVAAQLDRAGAYLRGSEPASLEAVTAIYSHAVARAWALTAIYVRILRELRGVTYAENFEWFAHQCLQHLKSRGETNLRFHPFDRPVQQNHLSVDTVLEWDNRPLPRAEAERMIANALAATAGQ